MPNFYYTDAYGQKQGLINELQLKELVARGIITRHTLLETEGGHKGLADQIPGLFDSVLPPFTFVPPVVRHSAPVHPVGEGKAITALILGIIGLIAWIIPLFGLPVTVIGLIMGILGMFGTKRGMAIAGFVMCIIGLMLTFINMAIGLYLGATGQF